MRVITKSYYKNSTIFNEGEYVKSIPSDVSKDEMDAFLKNKMLHESLHGNYSASEIEYIENHLSDTAEYNKANNNKFFNIKNITLIILGLFVLKLIFKLVSMFFGWIVFLSVITLITYPILRGQTLPNINKYVAIGLIATWILFGSESSDNLGSTIEDTSSIETMLNNNFYNLTTPLDQFNGTAFMGNLQGDCYMTIIKNPNLNSNYMLKLRYKILTYGTYSNYNQVDEVYHLLELKRKSGKTDGLGLKNPENYEDSFLEAKIDGFTSMINNKMPPNDNINSGVVKFYLNKSKNQLFYLAKLGPTASFQGSINLNKNQFDYIKKFFDDISITEEDNNRYFNSNIDLQKPSVIPE